MNTKQLVNKLGIRAVVDYAGSNPNAPEWREANHFKVTLKCGRRQLTTYFSQGYGVRGEPTAADVLDCLASDAATVENASTFEEWAEELGYDGDSRKAERIHKVIWQQSRKLRRFMGDKYNLLVWDTERL